jgi:hypothetical protein
MSEHYQAALIRVGHGYAPEVGISIDGRQWFVAGPRLGSRHGWYADNIEVIRPLVVIDPEDREQVERLAEAVNAAIASPERMTSLEVMQAALREFADPTPPKPDEPTGLGAVVVDESEVEWVHLGSGLWCYGTTDGPSHGFEWAHVHAVRVLSEGVQA